MLSVKLGSLLPLPRGRVAVYLVTVEFVEVEGEGEEVAPVEAVPAVKLESLLLSLPPSGNFTLSTVPVLLVVLLPVPAVALLPVPAALPSAVPVMPE